MKKYLLVITACLCFCAISAQDLPKTGDEKADAQLVRLAQQGWRVNGATVSFDGRTLYASMRKGQREVFDIWTLSLKNGRWMQPVLQERLSSDNNDCYPSVAADGRTIYFTREIEKNAGTKKAYKAACLFSSVRLPDGSWQVAQPMVIGDEHDSRPVILSDNVTLLFTSQRDKDEAPKRYMAQKLDKYNWTIPAVLPETVKDEKSLCKPNAVLTGTVRAGNTGKPIETQVYVFDAVTMQRLASESTDEEGRFRLSLTEGRHYKVEVYKNEWTHDFKTYDISSLNRDTVITWNPELSEQLTLLFRAYDNDNMFPLSPSVEVTSVGTGRRLATAAKKTDDGAWKVMLEMGAEYSLRFSQEAYADTVIRIDTRREARFSESEIDISMRMGRLPVKLYVVDGETREAIGTHVVLSNQTVKEDPVESDIEKDGLQMSLRCATSYLVQLNTEGYLYKDTTVHLPSAETTEPYVIRLAQMPLQKGDVIRLNNIFFEFNSSLLKEESYVELHTLAELMRRNPSLHIELSAHTDDVGSDSYNLRLSTRRGQAAIDYLVNEEHISPDRLKTIGYGETRPLVPNDSDENRAINRRVEFVVLDL